MMLVLWFFGTLLVAASPLFAVIQARRLLEARCTRDEVVCLLWLALCVGAFIMGLIMRALA